jgi:hypothetical protein
MTALAETRVRSTAMPPLIHPHELHDDQYVTVKSVPILDAHDDDPERGVVDERLLKLLAANSNRLVESGNPPALILGHTRPKETREVERNGVKARIVGVRETDQPPIIGHASGFRVASYAGRPCLHADFHYRAKDAEYARTFPYRSVERLEPPKGVRDPSSHAVDRIALLRTPPQRDLGIVRYERDDFRPIHYCKCQGPSAPPTPRRSNPMSAIDDRIHGIIGSYFAAHYAAEEQRKELEALRDQEGIDLDDEDIADLQNTDPEDFDKKVREVRRSYARRSHQAHGRVMGGFAPGSLMRRATALATREGCSYGEALAKLQAPC